MHWTLPVNIFELGRVVVIANRWLRRSDFRLQSRDAEQVVIVPGDPRRRVRHDALLDDRFRAGIQFDVGECPDPGSCRPSFRHGIFSRGLGCDLVHFTAIICGPAPLHVLPCGPRLRTHPVGSRLVAKAA